jgi:hypothetical protein
VDAQMPRCLLERNGVLGGGHAHSSNSAEAQRTDAFLSTNTRALLIRRT